MWKEKKISLGTVVEQSKNTAYFQHEGSLEVDKMESSCGCATPKFDSKTGVLSVEYKAKKVPPQLLHRGEYTTAKRIKVYHGKAVNTLLFTVRVIKK